MCFVGNKIIATLTVPTQIQFVKVLVCVVCFLNNNIKV